MDQVLLDPRYVLERDCKTHTNMLRHSSKFFYNEEYKDLRRCVQQHWEVLRCGGR